MTDCGNAERLIDQYGEAMRFCPAMRQWFVWNGDQWVADYGRAVQLAKKTVRSMQQERNLLLNQAERDPLDFDVFRSRAEAIAKWATRSESALRIASMLRLAESDPRISVASDDFNKDHWLLNLSNGTVELKSGSFREHRPPDLLTKSAGPPYIRGAKCPRWERFLDEVFEPHPELIPFLQKAVGYTLTGDIREECVFVLVGKGRNGKSTFLRVLHELLGEYGGIAQMETFLRTGGRVLREDIADMRGRRLVSAQEPALTGIFAEAILKWLSGGDQLRARRLYEHDQEFHPTHKLWFAMNRLPTIPSGDVAAWARLRIIPFDVCFNKMENRQLKYELHREISGILHWALSGCLSWQQNGLGSVPIIGKLTQIERNKNQVVA